MIVRLVFASDTALDQEIEQLPAGKAIVSPLEAAL
jgi:hypothetical protein